MALRPIGLKTEGGALVNAAGDDSGRHVVVGATASGNNVVGNPVLIAGSDGTVAVSLLTDVDGRQIIIGPAPSGTPWIGNPIMSGGSDGTNVLTLITDSTGRQVMVGAAASGAAVSGNPILTAGSDGTNALTLNTDSTGRQVMIGAAASGAAVVGNPVLMAGTDGTVAVSLLTDVDGRQMIIGPAPSGTPWIGNPIMSGGSDGTNILTLITDSTGRQVMVGAAASGSAVSGDPVLMAGTDGIAALTLKTNADGKILIGNDFTPVDRAFYYGTDSGFSYGLNVYQIYPKKYRVTMGGYQGGTSSKGLIYGGPTSNSQVLGNYYIGLNYYHATAWRDGINLIYDYVDASANIIRGATTALDGSNSVTLANGDLIKCLLKISTNVDLNDGDWVNLSYGSSSYNDIYCTAGLNYGQVLNGFVVVPDGYIGYFAFFNFYANSACDFTITKTDGISNPYGRQDIFKFFGQTSMTMSGQDLFGSFEAGTGVFVSKMTAAVTNSSYQACFILEAI